MAFNLMCQWFIVTYDDVVSETIINTTMYMMICKVIYIYSCNFTLSISHKMPLYTYVRSYIVFLHRWCNILLLFIHNSCSGTISFFYLCAKEIFLKGGKSVFYIYIHEIKRLLVKLLK